MLNHYAFGLPAVWRVKERSDAEIRLLLRPGTTLKRFPFTRSPALRPPAEFPGVVEEYFPREAEPAMDAQPEVA